MMNKTKSCCDHEHDQHAHDGHAHGTKKSRFDLILHGSLAIIVLSIVGYILAPQTPYLHVFAHTIMELLSKMWWGIVLGITFVGLMSKIPREYFTAILGRGDTYGGIIRATIAGIFLDLCSHGILMVGAKLYERGASIGQVMAFLIASPWNSLSLTIILIALIGLKWTLLFIAASALIAIATGIVYKILVDKKILPENPNKASMPENFSLKSDIAARLKTFKPTKRFFKDIAQSGWSEGRMLLRWLLLGIIIAASVRTFMPTESFEMWFGPSILGLFLTLAATTVIEVCSEGSAPIAAEILTRAAAPGNAFTFLMAGVSTDYTEILILREVTKSWKIALWLPLVTVPQVLVLGYIMNVMQ
jgi:uncharacterized membrane protein YraQ (UPF0718 family)